MPSARLPHSSRARRRTSGAARKSASSATPAAKPSSTPQPWSWAFQRGMLLAAVLALGCLAAQTHASSRRILAPEPAPPPAAPPAAQPFLPIKLALLAASSAHSNATTAWSEADFHTTMGPTPASPANSSSSSPPPGVRAMDGPPAAAGAKGLGWLEWSKNATPAASPPANLMRWLGSRRLFLEGMEEMVLPKGYPLERYVTLSGDGYQLVTFRIPYGAAGPGGPAVPAAGGGAARQPVLLIHGISLASTCWVVNGPSESLAFLLADRGYDVWMANTRGNTFSRTHDKYGASDSAYWRFSMDDLALTDLPQVVAHVRQVTGAAKVHVVGHSQGATVALAMLSRMPEARQRQELGVVVLLAPVVYVKYLESPALSSFCRQANVSLVLANLPPQEFLFMGKQTQELFLNGLCQTAAATPACVAATESMFGSSQYITTSMYRRYWQAWPSATSYWNALQWSQMYSDPGPPRFRQFQWGGEYDLTAVKAPCVLVSAGQDVLSTPRDVALVAARLKAGGALRGTAHVSDFGHMDVIWASSAAPAKLYGVVYSALERFT